MAIQKIQMIPPGYTDILHPESETDMIICKDGTTLTNTIDGVSTFQTAGGTATAITLTGVTFNNGLAKTFIASANNSGGATTVNTKPLYKPGGTTAPTLIAGKAYTIWYSLSSNCFFIKASAEGTVGVANVLAGQTFSNETDTGLVGTMVNRAGDTACLANSVSGTTLKLRASAGYRDGVDDNVTITDANFVASNIVGGKSIFGLTGTLDGDYVFKQLPTTLNTNINGQVIRANDDGLILLITSPSNHYVQKYTKDGTFVVQSGVIGSSTNTNITLKPDYYNQKVYVVHYGEEKSFNMSDLSLTTSRASLLQSYAVGSDSSPRYVEDITTGIFYTVSHQVSTGNFTIKAINTSGTTIYTKDYTYGGSSTRYINSVAVTDSYIYGATINEAIYVFSKANGDYIGQVSPGVSVSNDIRQIFGNGLNTFVTYLADSRISFVNNNLSMELQTNYAQGGNILDNGWTALSANNATDSTSTSPFGMYLISPTKQMYTLLHPPTFVTARDKFVFDKLSDGTLVAINNSSGKKIIKMKPFGLY